MLSDRELKERLPAIISPYDREMVQPSSIDVRLGKTFRVPTYHDAFFVDLVDPPKSMMKRVVVEEDEALTIHPGDFVLASTAEWLDMPDDLVCRLEGKSSVGRLGLVIHATAGFIDPGFKGNITLEMTNFLRCAIVLRPGLPIAQLAFQTLTSVVEKPYNGRYQGDRGATESRYGQTDESSLAWIKGNNPSVVPSWAPKSWQKY